LGRRTLVRRTFGNFRVEAFIRRPPRWVWEVKHRPNNPKITAALPCCLRRAYGDFQRTLHGIRNQDDFPRAKEARKRADEALSQMLLSIREMNIANQKQFDDWHRRACGRISAIYSECGYSSFYVGHAQKWINMTFKYIYVMGENPPLQPEKSSIGKQTRKPARNRRIAKSAFFKNISGGR
jgi:hypothetical protein